MFQARWSNEGLMTDPLSIENGAIMSNASRWSLMIDPQLQGIKWIMNRELPNGLKIIQQSQAKYIDTVSLQPACTCTANCTTTRNSYLTCLCEWHALHTS